MNTTRLAMSILALVASAGSVLAQGAAPVAPTPPAPPTPPAAPAEPNTRSWASKASAWTMSTSDDGRTIKLEGKNGAVLAEIDGKAVPAERVDCDGHRVVIKGENGEVLFEHDVPGMDTSSRTIVITGPNTSVSSTSPNAVRGRLLKLDPLDNTFQVTIDPPKVMIGVQLLDPDSSIRGHLGLKDDEATMVSGVYEGLAAHAAGLEPYDIIISIAGKSPAPPGAVRKALRETDAGKSISFEVVHRGQKKTVTVSPEKYDGDKITKAKLNTIAAATDAAAPNALAGVFNIDKDMAEAFAQAGGQWGGQLQGQSPFVAAIPGAKGGKPLTLWRNHLGHENEELAKRMQELAAEAQDQAKAAQKEAEAARKQADRYLLRSRPQSETSSLPATEMNRMMEERMKKLEELMQQMLEQHKNAKPAEAKPESKS